MKIKKKSHKSDTGMCGTSLTKVLETGQDLRLRKMFISFPPKLAFKNFTLKMLKANTKCNICFLIFRQITLKEKKM